MSRAPAPFIVGVGRSGTTLLRLMLDAHPDLAIPTETHFLTGLLTVEDNGLGRDQFLRAVIEAQTWPNFAVAETDFREMVNKIEPFSISEAIRTFYRLYARRFAKNRWGDKTPPYRGFMTGISRLLPEGHFIHLIRDGRDVALSHRGLWFGPGDDIEAQARFWMEQLKLARAQSADLPHYLEVKYETLVSDPGPTLRAICAYLELPYHPQMLEYYRFAADRIAEFKRPFGLPGRTPTNIEPFVAIHAHSEQPPDPSRIGRWRTEMSATEQQQYEAIAGALLHELGYETRFV